MIDLISNTANVAALIGNILIAIVTAYGYARFGRQRFLLLFLLASPIVILMDLSNTLAGLGKTTVLAVLPGKCYAIVSLAAIGLYPIAMVLALCGTITMVKYVKAKEQ